MWSWKKLLHANLGIDSPMRERRREATGGKRGGRKVGRSVLAFSLGVRWP
jgi:hypothetical protein